MRASNPARVALAAFLQRHPELRGLRLALAVSGGADSSALLLAAAELLPASDVLVLHVHHGLQAEADSFAAAVQQRCAALGLELRVLRAEVATARGDSLEERARSARYAALSQAAHDAGCGALVLAHQADDQAESLLLALLRGAGVAGLAAMPALTRRHGLWLARPLLELPGAALRDWLQAAGHAWCDDPMNADPQWRRVAIRQQLLPVLQRLEPAWRDTLGRSARLCAQAQAIVDARAAEDVDAAQQDGALRRSTLLALPPPRLAEALRCWLGRAGVRSHAGQIDNLCRQLRAADPAALRIEMAGASLGCDGELLHLRLH